MAEAAKRLYKAPPSRAKQMLAQIQAEGQRAVEAEFQAREQFQHVVNQRLRLEGALTALTELVKGEG